jgi:FtsP/CotA-like multicopper oxidase with cupredoxin domain
VLVLADPNVGDSASVLEVAMTERMTGREGSAILVNGLAQPRIGAPCGTVEHGRFINANSSRYHALTLDGHPLQQIGSDGGRLDRPHPTDELVLAPGERAEVVVPLNDTGTFALVTRPVDRGGVGMTGQGGGMGSGMARGATNPTQSTVIATLDVSGTIEAAPELPATLGTTAHPSPDSVVGTAT